jgi:hypothetical protein
MFDAQTFPLLWFFRGLLVFGLGGDPLSAWGG